MWDWISEFDLNLDGRTTAAVVAAGAAIVAAYFSWVSARKTLSKEYLQTKIEVLALAVAKLHDVDFVGAGTELAYSVGFGGDKAFVGTMDFIRATNKNCSLVAAAAVPVGHYMTPERQVNSGRQLSDMFGQYDQMLREMNKQAGAPAYNPEVLRMTGVLRDYRNLVSHEIQEELDDAVAALKRTAGTKA